MSKVIKGGMVCTADRTWKADVLIEGEIIKQIGEDLVGDEYIDAEGAYVIPGGIDPHTHLEMPFMGTHIRRSRHPLFAPAACIRSHAALCAGQSWSRHAWLQYHTRRHRPQPRFLLDPRQCSFRRSS